MTIVKKKTKIEKPPIPFVPFHELPTILAVLVYGRSGTGKTTFASTFPKPLLLLDVRERGTDSVSNVSGGDVASIETWEELESVYWYLEAGKHKYKTVVIDQVTQLQDLAMIKALKDAGKQADDSISRRDFGQASGLMKTWLLNYRNLIDAGMHVVFLAHDRVTTNEEDSGEDQIDPVVGPRLMPSVASFVNGSVKIIGNTFIRETFTLQNKRKVRSVEYCMRIGPHAYYTTKARSPVGIAAPDSIVDPTYDKLVDIVRGDYSKPTTVRRKK